MLRHLRPTPKPVNPVQDSVLWEKAARAARLVEAYEAEGSGWFWETDAEGRLTYLSAHVRETLATRGPDPFGLPLTDVFHLESEDNASSRTLQFHLSVKSAFRNIAVRSKASGENDAWYITGKPRFGAGQQFEGFVGSATDLAEKRRSQAAITRLAYTDGLTGLANRERMHTTLEHLLATRQSGFDPTALLLLDLDRFKSINDTLGHQTGDELLKQVAQRILRVIGKTGVVGRLGGDEFQVVLASDNARARAERTAQDIIHSISQPYTIKGTPITIGCSVGIAIAPEQGQTVESLVRNADLALYAAKDSGRSTWRIYTEDLLTDAKHRKQMEDDLRRALANNEMHVAYQAVVSTVTESIVGYEALVRWHHPTRGAVSPGEFIPIAEENGLIAGIGEWVLRTAINDCAGWPGSVRVAVNVSPLQFANPKLPAVIASALAAASLDPDRLEIEITESVFLASDGDTDRTFKAIKDLGVRLALDDFGTGYSSLSYLQSAPFDKIKIDQSFVRGAIMAGNRNAAIIKAIVTLANTLGLETTAEGVEQQDEIAFVRELGCSHIQGFVYGRPDRYESVLETLKLNGLQARPVGHKISRAPRERVLLKAHLKHRNRRSEAVIRNTSINGVMLESECLSAADVGAQVLIELLQGQVWTGAVRWVDGDKAGIALARQIDQPPAD